MGQKAYKITLDQKLQIEKKSFLAASFFNPVKDINGDYFIFEEEHKQCGLGVKTEFIAPEPEENIV